MGGRLQESDSRALLVFSGGILLLFAFFAIGAYLGASSAPTGERIEPGGSAAVADGDSGRLFRVEVAVVESQDKAAEIVALVRRQYASAWVALEETDRRFHVYVGPYPLDQANLVRAELEEDLGMQAVKVVPDR